MKVDSFSVKKVMMVALAGILFSLPTLAAPNWNISGTWNIDFTLSNDASHRYHAMNVNSFATTTGEFVASGETTGTEIPPAPILYTWSATGTVAGDGVTLQTVYNEIPGYFVDLIGTTTNATSMAGTWADNAGNSGTWVAAGQAVGLAEITVIKQVNNAYGGTSTPADFPLFVGQIPVSNGVTTTIPVGMYTVSESNLPGYQATFSGDCDASGTISLQVGNIVSCTITNNDQPAEIHGYKFHDLNGNGQWNGGEPALSGWTIYLDLNNSGTFNGGEPFSITDGSGAYQFTNLSAGTYRVREIPQAGWVQTLPYLPDEYLVAVNAGEVLVDRDFGNFHPATVRGIKYEDKNANAKRDLGEPTLAGWTIKLYGYLSIDNSYVEYFTNTNGSGQFEFTGVMAGSYRLTEVSQAGWAQTEPKFNLPHTVLINQSGQIASGFSIGNFKMGRIYGIKYHDLNKNGRKDAGEPLLPGWIIRVAGITNNFQATAITDALGNFDFPAIPPGKFLVSEVAQPGWFPWTPRSLFYQVTMLQSGAAKYLEFGNILTSQLVRLPF